MIILRRVGLKVHFEGKFEEIKILKEDILSVAVPGAFFTNAYRRFGWNGKHKFYERNNTFYFGLLNYVKKSLKKNNIKFSFKNENEELQKIENIKFSKWVSSKERDYQLKSVSTFINTGEGIIKLPTRAGKTVVTSEVIRILLENKRIENAFFIVDSKDLFEQSLEEIKKFTGIKEIGKIRGNEFQIEKITVAMIQTCTNLLKKSKKNVENRTEFIKYLYNLDFLIVDEVHCHSSDNRLSLFKRCFNLKYVLGISATPYKRNKLNRLKIQSFFGDIISEVKEEQLIKNKILAINKTLLLMLEHEYDDLRYQDMYDKYITNNKNRNDLIKFVVDICKKLNLKILILVSIRKHGSILKDLLNAEFISGSDDSEIRKQQKEKFLKGKGGVLIASNIFNKGITLTSTEVLINAGGGKDENLLIQKRGRILGANETKEKALCVDFIDLNEKYFSNHSLSRIKTYERKLDKKDIIVLDSSDKEFKEYLEDELTEFFEK